MVFGQLVTHSIPIWVLGLLLFFSFDSGASRMIGPRRGEAVTVPLFPPFSMASQEVGVFHRPAGGKAKGESERASEEKKESK